MVLTKKLWIGIAILVVLTPLGLILPYYFKAQGAWGEGKIMDFWIAPLRDYSFKGWEDKGLVFLCFSYIIAAIVGVAVISGIVFIIGKMLARKND